MTSMELAAKMAEAYKEYRRAYSEMVMAEANRSVVHYSVLGALRSAYEGAGQKVTESKLDAESKCSIELVGAIAHHGKCIVACGDAEAAYMLAKAAYTASLTPPQ